MIIIMKPGASKEHLDKVIGRIRDLGYEEKLLVGVSRTVIAAIGDARGKQQLMTLEAMPGIEKIVTILKPAKLTDREYRKEDTIIDIKGVKIGGGHFVVMAGPCSVESKEQVLEVAREVKKSGATILRGGAYKPRSSPYSFQGLEEEGLKMLREASDKTGLPVVTEVITPQDIDLVGKYADMLQVGARNMQNYDLLKKLGKTKKPVLLKRGMMSTIDELFLSAEYIISEGNPNVVLCERGIRTFETATRYTLDIAAVPIIKKMSHLPVIVDPSHATGKRDLVEPVSKAAIAAGADGLMIEVHPCPEDAYCDGKQSLVPGEFAKIMKALAPYLELAGKKIQPF